MRRIAVRLLGPFEVTIDGAPVTGFAYAKVRALLAYLAVEPRQHTRAALATLLSNVVACVYLVVILRKVSASSPLSTSFRDARAIGRAEMVKADWVKPGAIVVDFGTTYTDDGLKGDCDQAGVAAVAGQLTPVPGGTGPMTNMMLMENLLAAAKLAVG